MIGVREGNKSCRVRVGRIVFVGAGRGVKDDLGVGEGITVSKVDSVIWMETGVCVAVRERVGLIPTSVVEWSIGFVEVGIDGLEQPARNTKMIRRSRSVIFFTDRHR